MFHGAHACAQKAAYLAYSNTPNPSCMNSSRCPAADVYICHHAVGIREIKLVVARASDLALLTRAMAGVAA